MSNINANYGVVRAVSNNRSTIKIAMPRGGVFECRNEGFEIGQSVCFILDSLKRQIIKVLPKEIADAQLIIGQDTALQEALQEQPTAADAEIYDDMALMEEMTNGKNGDKCNGHSDEERIDLLSRVDGEEPGRRYDADWPGHQY